MLGMIHTQHGTRDIKDWSTGSVTYRFNMRDMEILHRFQNRTLKTLGSNKTKDYLQKELLIHACQVRPFLWSNHG
jgi:hypothetical protein